MNFKENIKHLVKDELSAMDLVINNILNDKAQLVKDITYHIIQSGGKRLRPILAILSAKLFAYSGNRHINLAAAVEFLHTATLLHDDVVDQSNLRRGLQTANFRWDNKSSVLVGDVLLAQSFLLMAEDNDLEVIKILAKASSIIAEGEVKQLASIANLSISLADYIQIISAKTAELFATSCKVGSIVGRATSMQQNSMYLFGLNLGITFQIIDDILDYQASEINLGKTIGDDFREGKVTLPIIVAYALSDAQEKQFWQRTITELSQSQEDFAQALIIFTKYDIVNKCLAIAENYINQAKENLAVIPDNQIKSILMEILEFSLQRHY